jgi:hypothetical protein
VTESEWLTCDDPQKMLGFLRGKASERKLRLFAVACCRLFRGLPQYFERVWQAVERGVEVAERYADGQAGEGERDAALEEMYGEPQWFGPMAAAAALMWRAGDQQTVTVSSRRDRREQWPLALASALRAAAYAASRIGAEEVREPGAEARGKPTQAARLRDLFGNPFRPATLDPAWLSWNNGTVGKMALVAYDQRALPSELDPARLAVLADALEESGCHDQELLTHLRGPGPHVRGCWVVDLLLGKS